MDATCSCALLLWRQALDAITRIVGAISYAPLMVLRQFVEKQFIPVTGGLEQLEFSYEDFTAAKEIDQVMKFWKQTLRINMGLVASKVTLEYVVWKV